MPLIFSLNESRLPLFMGPFLTAYVAGFAGTYLSIHLAQRLNRLDHPGERSSHTMPMPRFGGIGIALGVFAATSIFAVPIENIAYACAIWTGALFALLFGLLDDVRPMAALPKLGCQLVCASIPPMLGLAFFPGIIGSLLAFGWILFFMNAYNFMDGMDGMTASFGMLACVAMLCPLMLAWNYFDAPHFRVLLLLAITAALLAFWRFNRTPARTFMGDGGSQMLGYMLALALVAMPCAIIPGAFLAFWPFVFDVSYTLIQRSMRGENLLVAHREHLYQRLLRAGLTHPQCLRRVLFFQIICVAASVYASVGWLMQPRGDASQVHFYRACVAVAIATIAYVHNVIRFEKRVRGSA